MRWLIFSVAFAGLGFAVAFVQAAPTYGHFGGTAFIVVTSDHVNPGEEFNVVGADLTPNAEVEFRFERDDLKVTLPGTVTPGVDGHFTAQLSMPAEFPDGYALLVAEAADGTQTSTWVLVGVRTATTPPPPDQPAWWADPSVIVLGVAVLGGLGALGYAAWRRRQPQRVPVAAGTAHKRSSGKAQRRAGRRGQG